MNIQHLIEQAREDMLTEGGVIPMIYLELTNGLHIFYLDIINTQQSIPVQCGIIARLAWESCKKYPGEKPVAIAFCAEAWRVRGDANIEEKLMPVKSAKREEIILVQLWQAKASPRIQSYALSVIRDHQKQVIDVRPDEAPTNSSSYQLASFLQGALDAQKPDEEVFGNLNRAIDESIDRLSPEKRQELMDYLRREGML